MAIGPLPLSTNANILSSNRLPPSRSEPSINQTRQRASVTSIDDSIQTAKNGSLLYQVISRLLLTSEQDKQLSDSLNKIEETQEHQALNSIANIANEPITTLDSNSLQFSMTIELTVLNVNQQTLLVNDETGSFIQQTTVVEAISMRIDLSFGILETEESDPLVIDVNGDGITTTGVEQGAKFDINADGTLDQVSVTTGDNVFLALDVNHNGFIDDGSELFGDQTGYKNGFSYLASFDDNHDNVIDANDRIFNSLLTFRLIDNEQFIEKLSDTNVKSINLTYNETADTTDAGDRIVQISDYKSSDGQTGVVADLLLQYKSGINK